MEDPKVSVVIPCYNMESYVERCVDSILKQTYSNIEIICVDDLSTDDTLKILNNLKREIDAKFIGGGKCLILCNLKLNVGVGAARDIGMGYATGKYIMFVDPDDFISENTISSCIDLIDRYKADMVEFGYERVSGHIGADMRADIEYSIVKSNKEIERKSDHICCNKLYKSDIIKDNNLKFRYRIFEDTRFTREYALLCGKAVFINNKFYKYFYNPNSATSYISQDRLENNVRTEEVIDLYLRNGMEDRVREYMSDSLKFLIRHLIPLSHMRHVPFEFIDKKGSFAIMCKDIISIFNRNGFLFRIKAYRILGFRSSLKLILKYSLKK